MRLHVGLGLTMLALSIWSLIIYLLLLRPGSAAELGLPPVIMRLALFAGPMILCAGLFWTFWGGDSERCSLSQSGTLFEEAGMIQQSANIKLITSTGYWASGSVRLTVKAQRVGRLRTHREDFGEVI